MKIFAIGDLHLPGKLDKSMDMFGEAWVNHFEKIKASWRAKVLHSDVVLIPGDISWAMSLENAMEDLESIAALPGRKVLLKGNHDYWWSSLTRIKAVLPKDMFLVQNDVVEFDELLIGGSRGWLIPCQNVELPKEDVKIYEREVNRLALSLHKMRNSNKPKIGMLHFPPLLEYERNTGFSTLFTEYQIPKVVYGHLHGDSIKTAFSGMHNGVDYTLCSADALNFSVKEIMEVKA
ncbi:MAG: metallophosphoesterase [Eubacteriales bacterium]|nr:metallophosphoesterase [Eubacteriales bacterium]